MFSDKIILFKWTFLSEFSQLARFLTDQVPIHRRQGTGEGGGNNSTCTLIGC